MKKTTKIWLKQHKKDILMNVLSVAGGTCLYFLIKEKRGIRSNVRLSLNFLDDISLGSRGDSTYINANISDPTLSVGDLGKLSDILKRDFYMISEDTKVQNINIQYNKYGKGVYSYE